MQAESGSIHPLSAMRFLPAFFLKSLLRAGSRGGLSEKLHSETTDHLLDHHMADRNIQLFPAPHIAGKSFCE